MNRQIHQIHWHESGKGCISLQCMSLSLKEIHVLAPKFYKDYMFFLSDSQIEAWLDMTILVWTTYFRSTGKLTDHFVVVA